MSLSLLEDSIAYVNRLNQQRQLYTYTVPKERADVLAAVPRDPMKQIRSSAEEGGGGKEEVAPGMPAFTAQPGLAIDMSSAQAPIGQTMDYSQQSYTYPETTGYTVDKYPQPTFTQTIAPRSIGSTLDQPLALPKGGEEEWGYWFFPYLNQPSYPAPPAMPKSPGYPSMNYPAGPTPFEEFIQYTGIGTQLARGGSALAKALSSPSDGLPEDIWQTYVKGNIPLPDDIWDQYVTNPDFTPTTTPIDPSLHYLGRDEALVWEPGMGEEILPGSNYVSKPLEGQPDRMALEWEEGMGEEEPGLLSDIGNYLGKTSDVVGTALTLYNTAKLIQEGPENAAPIKLAQVGANIGGKALAQTTGSSALSNVAPYMAYYQMGAAAGEIAKFQDEPVGRYSGYPTEPLMAAPMSGARILGSVLGGEADLNARQLAEEQQAPEKVLLGKEEWNTQKTATAMNPALDPINIATSVVTGKDSGASELTAALANPAGALAKHLVGSMFGKNPATPIGKVWDSIPTLEEAKQGFAGKGFSGTWSTATPDFMYLKEHPDKIPSEVWNMDLEQYINWFRGQIQSNPEVRQFYQEARQYTDPFQASIPYGSEGYLGPNVSTYGVYDEWVGAYQPPPPPPPPQPTYTMQDPMDPYFPLAPVVQPAIQPTPQPAAPPAIQAPQYANWWEDPMYAP